LNGCKGLDVASRLADRAWSRRWRGNLDGGSLADAALDASAGQHHPPALPLPLTGACPRRQRGIVIVPGDQRAHRLRQLRGGIALCLAVILALTPRAQLIPTAALHAAAALAVGSYASDGGASRGEAPVLGVPGDHPDAGILPRLPHLEGALPSSAQKAVLPRPSASIDPSPPEKAAPETAAGTGFHRSSVGTARKPTGPPA
jgi:hypothetical protein